MYATIENKSFLELKKELEEVFLSYDEYTDFNLMVKLFAEDDFYNLHFVAKEFLRIKAIRAKTKNFTITW